MDINEVAKRIPKAELARVCGITRQAVNTWKMVPPQHVMKVAKRLGIDPAEIRPDIFGEVA